MIRFRTVKFSSAAFFETRKQFSRLIVKIVFQYLTESCHFQTKIDQKILKILNSAKSM